MARITAWWARWVLSAAVFGLAAGLWVGDSGALGVDGGESVTGPKVPPLPPGNPAANPPAAPATVPNPAGGVMPPRAPVVANPQYSAETLTDEQVLESITRGCDFLLARWNAQVLPTRKGDNIDGVRMLAVYALLQAGKATGDPRLRFSSEQMAPHVKWLSEFSTDYTYTAALQACALSLLPRRDEFSKPLARVHNLLMGGMQHDGSYTYHLMAAGIGDSRKGMGTFDNSNSQYGLLGVWMASDYGLEVSTTYWKMVDQHWRRNQARDGGWDYATGGGKHTESMTAAGVASLYVTTDNLFLEARLEPRRDAALERGLAAMVQDFDPNTNDLYYLYSLERVGLASGLKFFGKYNWYRQVAANLLNWQNRDGGWDSYFWSMPRDVAAPPAMPADVATSYAILFLVRGRAPVVFNKLEYNGPWNARERDDANLTAWMSKKFERPINWQVVNLATDSTDWLDAPILLVAGSKDPNFGPEDLGKLRRFVNAGGLIFSTTDGGKLDFLPIVRKYANQLSGGVYEMREIPADHAIYNIHTKIKNPPRLYGLTNGARELWIHSPIDMGAAWQMRATAKTELWDIPSNIFFYATGKGTLRTKLQPLTVPEATEKPVRTIRLAHVAYNGNHDPEPSAWPRLDRLTRLQARTALEFADVRMRNLAVARAPIAQMTGTAAYKLTAAEQLKLRAYLESGGTLIADSCGGSTAFTRSFVEMIRAMYPEGLQPIPLEHAIYNGSLADAVAIKEVTFRSLYVLKEGPQNKPRLLGLKLGDRYAVIFSPEDITSGLLGTNTWGIMGYAPESSQRLARNILLYAYANAAREP